MTTEEQFGRLPLLFYHLFLANMNTQVHTYSYLYYNIAQVNGCNWISPIAELLIMLSDAYS